MTDASDRFLDAVSDLGITTDVVRYPEGTRTARDAAAAIGCTVAQIVKSLVFVATTEGEHTAVLALTAGDRRVDTAALAEAIGADHVRKASAEEAREATGFAIGGTPPFGHARPVATYLDPHLLEHTTVWAAAGTPTTVFRLAPTDLERAGAVVVGDFTED